MPNENLVFFSRCRPQNADPIDIAIKSKRVFIGYPAWRKNVSARSGHLREAVIDIQCTDEEWAAVKCDFSDDGRQYQKNRNLARSIKPGAIALIPRPNRGFVYAGRVVKPFVLLDDPPWGKEYLELRRSQGLEVSDECNHLADVAQCCEVDRFHEIPFSRIPAWIRRSFFGRSTYGFVGPLEILDLDPYAELDRLLDSPTQAERSWTDDITEIQRRLVDAIGPNAFEHLCVALLQLEYPQETWMHVGGSGDGGIDGMGVGPDGTTVGLLQCKWACHSADIEIAAPTVQGFARQFLASLIHPADVTPPKGTHFWSRTDVARLIIKHAERLPIAISLRVKPK